jgi:glycosyltransferase involved in cell wall biosynthesis
VRPYDAGHEGVPRPRVLHVSQPVDGGTASVLQLVAMADRDHGHEVAIASPPGQLEHWARYAGVRWTRLDLNREPTMHDLWSLRELRRLLVEVDLVFLHSSKAGAVGRIACSTLRRRRRPACVFVPHAWSWYVGGRASTLYRRFERIAALWADAIVTVSRREALDGSSALSAAGARKIVVIENGVDCERFSPPGARSERAAAPLLVCVGRFCEQKGQDILVRALAALGDPTVRLRLVGAGPAESSLRALCDELGMGDRVEFVGSVDPRPHYWAADLVVLPSRWEGQSLVLLEAMACGATVLASSAAASGFGRDQGVVDLGGPEVVELARAITDLLTSPATCRELGDRARATVEKHHSTSRVSQDYLQLADTLLRLPADGALVHSSRSLP